MVPKKKSHFIKLMSHLKVLFINLDIPRKSLSPF